MKTRRAGPMRHRIDVVDRTESPDASGGLPTADVVLETIWGSIEQVTERVVDDFGRVDNVIVHRIETRFSPNIDEDKKLVFSGRAFEILSIDNVRQLGKELIIRAAEGRA